MQDLKQKRQEFQNKVQNQLRQGLIPQNKIFFYSPIQKQSESGIFWNKRLLVVFRGNIFYFTKLHENDILSEQSINQYKEPAKQLIEFQDIVRIDKNNDKKFGFTLQIEKKYLKKKSYNFKQEQILKQFVQIYSNDQKDQKSLIMKSQKENNDVQVPNIDHKLSNQSSIKSEQLKPGDIKKWKYACKNEKDYEIWLDILEYITNPTQFYQKYNIIHQQILPEIELNQSDFIKKTHSIFQDPQNESDEIQEKEEKNNQNFLQIKHSPAKIQEKNQILQEISISYQNIENIQKIEKLYCENFIFNVNCSCVQADNYQLKCNQLIDNLVEFRNSTFKIFMEIINDKLILESQRIYHKSGQNGRIELFFIDNITFQIASSYEIQVDDSVIDQSDIKDLKEQFRAINYAFQKIVEIKKQNIDYHVYPPLAQIMEFRGFVCLAVCQIDSIKKNELLNTQNSSPLLEYFKIFNRSGKLQLMETEIPEIESQCYILQNFSGFFLDQNHQKQRPEFMQLIQPENEDQYFFTNQLNNLVTLLENNDESLYGTELSNLIHENGISVNCLGQIFEITKFEFLRQVLACEMIARSCKKILRFQHQKLIQSTIYDINLEKNKEYQNQFAYLEKQFIIDFLNSIFGIGNKKEKIYVSLKHQLKYDFDWDLDTDYIIPGYLLHAISQHCKIKFQFDSKTSILISHNPFSLDDFIETVPHVKILTLDKIPFVSNCLEYTNLVKQNNLNEALSKLLDIMQLQNDLFRGHKQDNYQEQKILLEYLLVYSEKSQYQGEEIDRYSKEALELSHPLHINAAQVYIILMKYKMENKEFIKGLQYFDKALQIIDFHLGDFHPTHIKFYNIVANYYFKQKLYGDSLSLYKNSLICGIKQYGPIHLKVADLHCMIGIIYEEMGCSEQVIEEMKKVKEIYHQLGKQKTFENAKICQILSSHKIEKSDSLNQIFEAIKIIEDLDLPEPVFLGDCYIQKYEILKDTDDGTQSLQIADKLWGISQNYRKQLLREYKNQLYEQIFRIIAFSFIKNLKPKFRTWLLLILKYLDNQAIQEQSLLNLLFECEKINDPIKVIRDSFTTMCKYYKSQEYKNVFEQGLEINMIENQLFVQSLYVYDQLIQLLGSSTFIQQLQPDYSAI